MKNIKMSEILEVRDLNFRDVLGFKGAEKVIDLLSECVEKDYSIVCYGVQGTGKTLVLKTLLYQLGIFDEKITCDDCSTDKEIRSVATGKFRYATVYGDKTEDLVERLTEAYGKANKIILVKCENVIHDGNSKKCVTSLDEIVNNEGNISTVNLISSDKGKYHINH